MSSHAQDARHERMMQEAKDKVFDLEQQIQAKQSELKKLENELAVARKKLAFHEAIDMDRD